MAVNQANLFEGVESFIPDEYDYQEEYSPIETELQPFIKNDIETNNSTALSVVNSSIDNYGSDLKIEKIKDKIEWLKNFQNLLFKELKKDIDFFNIQGSYMLTKAGSAKTQYITNTLCQFEVIKSTTDFEIGLFDYTIKAKIVDKNNHNFVFGEGIGSDSTFDNKNYHEWVDESKLPFYYLQFIDFEKYIKPQIDKLDDFKKKYSFLSKEMLDKRVLEYEKNLDRRLNRKIVDPVTNKTLELEDIESKQVEETKWENKRPVKTGVIKTEYKIPKKEINLASLNHKTREMACKRAEAFACRRAFDLDEILKRINKDDSPENSSNNNDHYYCTCQECGTVITEKVAKFSKSKYKKELCMNCQNK